MATRNTTFLLKRSNVLSKIPPLSGLTMGELALNTADAKLYTLYTGGLTGATEVREIGWNRLSTQSGGTVNGLTNFTNGLISNTISASTYYNLPIDPDNYVTGGTFSTGTLTLNRQNGSVTITGFSSGVDTYVTGFTYDNSNNLTISQNQGQSPLNVNISIMSGLTINGNLTVTGNTRVNSITGTSAVFSGSGTNILTIIGSGSTTPLFTVQGSSGELFSVTDSLVGSLFSVNNVSGLPILEVFSDNTILMGDYLSPSLNTTTKVTANSGITNIYSIPTSAYTGAFFEYTVNDGTNLRAGNIMSIWNDSTVNYTETSTNDIGDTTPITFDLSISSGLAYLRTSATTNSWVIKTIIRSI